MREPDLTNPPGNRMAIPGTTERISNGHDFPEYFDNIMQESNSAPNTELSLDNGFYRLMRPFLDKHGYGDNGQTYTASHVTAAARDAHSDPHSEAHALITKQFLHYLRTVCEADLGRWALKDRDTPLEDNELWEYVCCALRPKLNMRGTMPIGDGGHYVQNGHPTPAIFEYFRRYDEKHGLVDLLVIEGERRRCYALPFTNRQLLDLKAVGIDLPG